MTPIFYFASDCKASQSFDVVEVNIADDARPHYWWLQMTHYLLELVRRIARPLRRVGLISAGALLGLGGCASETLFQSSFN
jgi:hypothetical protein